MFADDEDAVGHLHIIITHPNEKNEVITISVTSYRKGMDTMVTLNKGDHPRITHLSVLAFAHACIRTIPQIEALMKSYDATKKEPVSEEILERCRKGVAESDATVNEVRTFLAFLKS